MGLTMDRTDNTDQTNSVRAEMGIVFVRIGGISVICGENSISSSR